MCDESGNPIAEPNTGKLLEQLHAAIEHQANCKAQAQEFLQLYFTQDGAIDVHGISDWLEQKGALDRWFFVHLIEAAGFIFVEKALSAHKAEIARAKNAPARTWVLERWETRTDKGQSKAAFGREYAHLVKKAFGTNVTPETIARDWLIGRK